MSISLRPYQLEVLQKIQDSAKSGKKRILVTCPTGSGKSHIALSIAIHAMNNNIRSLIWAPRREICWQLAKVLLDMDIDYGIILADEPHDPTCLIQIASIQSLYVKGIRRKSISLPKADVVIQDECHRSAAESHQKVIAMYPNSFHVGMTATPIRKTGVGLGTIFDDLIVGPSISELTEQGFLCPVSYYVPSVPDLTKLKTIGGDYSEKDLAPRVDQVKLIGDILENFTRICPKAKAIVSACGIAHSQHISDSFNHIGIKAAHLDGRTPERERDRIVKQYQDNEIQILSNADLFSEGVDFPDIECLIFARPTKSLGRWLQICGRGLRPSPGKKKLILLDHSGAFLEHGPLDQDFNWKLDYGRKRTINKFRQKKKEKELKKWITCKKCTCVYTGRIDCPECGEIVKIKGQPVETFDAYLEEITESDKHQYVTAEQAVWWAAFKFEAMRKIDYARAKDGLPARAYRLYINKFGCLPRGFNKNIPAKEGPMDVLAWIGKERNKWFIQQRIKNKIENKTDTWNWKQEQAPSHSLVRKEELGGSAYQPESPVIEDAPLI